MLKCTLNTRKFTSISLIYRIVPYKRPLPYKRPSPSIGKMSAKRPSRYEYQLNDPPPLLSKCLLRDPGSFEWYSTVDTK